MGITLFQTVTLAVAIELFVIGKARQDTENPYPASWVAAVLVANYGLLLFYNLAIYPVFVDPLRNVPGPRYGNMLALKVWYNHVFTKRKIAAQFYTEIARNTPNEGIIAIRSFGSTMIVLTKPHTIATVLVNERLNYTKPPMLRKFLRPLLGDGLVFLEGEEHRFGRKHTQPAFYTQQIHDLYPMMWSKAREMVDVINKSMDPGAESGKVEIVKWATRVSLDVIGLAGLGHDFHSLTDVKDKLAGDYEELTETSWGKLLWFLLSSRLSPEMTRFILPGISKTMEDRVTSVRNTSTQLILDKMAATKNGADGQVDILSLLINSNDFSEAQLTDHLLTLLVSGHETTSVAFVWICYRLAIHEDVQKRLRTEVVNAIAGAEPSQLPAILEGLPYLNAVMLEVLRLYPPLPMQSRVADVDTFLLGHPIAKSTRVLIPAWIVNRAPELWGDDADEFRPDRWIDEDGKHNNMGGGSIGSMTFGRGPRGCIGENFTKAEIRCMMSAMLTTFEWTLDMSIEDVVPSGSVTVRPANGLHLMLKKIA